MPSGKHAAAQPFHCYLSTVARVELKLQHGKNGTAHNNQVAFMYTFELGFQAHD